MKQEITPKAIIAVVVAGVVIFAGMAMTGCRAAAETAAETTAAAADGANSPPQTRREQGKAMADEMRSHARGAQRER